MNVSLPVIASDIPSWQRIIKENQCGLCVDPLDPQEIAQAIEYLYTHPSEAKQMGENGRRALLTRYSWEGEAKKLLDLYRDLCAIETT